MTWEIDLEAYIVVLAGVRPSVGEHANTCGYTGKLETEATESFPSLVT